mgnify:CR=1 FL=1
MNGNDKGALPLDDLYREVLLDHYRRPRGRQPLTRPGLTVEGFNPSCGDQLQLGLALAGDTVEEAHVDSHGCSISVASGSIMAEMIRGRSRAEIARLIAGFKGLMQGRPVDPQVDLGDLEALEGVRKFPLRVKCALLPWTTLEEALAGPGADVADAANAADAADVADVAAEQPVREQPVPERPAAERSGPERPDAASPAPARPGPERRAPER